LSYVAAFFIQKPSAPNWLSVSAVSVGMLISFFFQKSIVFKKLIFFRLSNLAPLSHYAVECAAHRAPRGVHVDVGGRHLAPVSLIFTPYCVLVNFTAGPTAGCMPPATKRLPKEVASKLFGVMQKIVTLTQLKTRLGCACLSQPCIPLSESLTAWRGDDASLPTSGWCTTLPQFDRHL